jgi:hypothetical protein
VDVETITARAAESLYGIAEESGHVGDMDEMTALTAPIVRSLTTMKHKAEGAKPIGHAENVFITAAEMATLPVEEAKKIWTEEVGAKPKENVPIRVPKAERQEIDPTLTIKNLQRESAPELLAEARAAVELEPEETPRAETPAPITEPQWSNPWEHPPPMQPGFYAGNVQAGGEDYFQKAFKRGKTKILPEESERIQEMLALGWSAEAIGLELRPDEVVSPAAIWREAGLVGKAQELMEFGLDPAEVKELLSKEYSIAPKVAGEYISKARKAKKMAEGGIVGMDVGGKTNERMIPLYRGLKTPFKAFSPQLQAEKNDLERVMFAWKESGRREEDLPSYARLKELRKIGHGQYFGGNRDLAADYAGPTGFIVSMQVPESEAERALASEWLGTYQLPAKKVHDLGKQYGLKIDPVNLDAAFVEAPPKAKADLYKLVAAKPGKELNQTLMANPRFTEGFKVWWKGISEEDRQRYIVEAENTKRLPGMWSGGQVGMAHGGPVPTRPFIAQGGTPGVDSIPLNLAPGTVVVRKSVMDSVRDQVGLADGGQPKDSIPALVMADELILPPGTGDADAALRLNAGDLSQAPRVFGMQDGGQVEEPLHLAHRLDKPLTPAGLMRNKFSFNRAIAGIDPTHNVNEDLFEFWEGGKEFLRRAKEGKAKMGEKLGPFTVGGSSADQVAERFFQTDVQTGSGNDIGASASGRDDAGFKYRTNLNAVDAMWERAADELRIGIPQPPPEHAAEFAEIVNAHEEKKAYNELKIEQLALRQGAYDESYLSNSAEAGESERGDQAVLREPESGGEAPLGDLLQSGGSGIGNAPYKTIAAAKKAVAGRIKTGHITREHLEQHRLAEHFPELMAQAAQVAGVDVPGDGDLAGEPSLSEVADFDFDFGPDEEAAAPSPAPATPAAAGPKRMDLSELPSIAVPHRVSGREHSSPHTQKALLVGDAGPVTPTPSPEPPRAAAPLAEASSVPSSPATTAQPASPVTAAGPPPTLAASAGGAKGPPVKPPKAPGGMDDGFGELPEGVPGWNLISIPKKRPTRKARAAGTWPNSSEQQRKKLRRSNARSPRRSAETQSDGSANLPSRNTQKRRRTLPHEPPPRSGKRPSTLPSMTASPPTLPRMKSTNGRCTRSNIPSRPRRPSSQTFRWSARRQRFRNSAATAADRWTWTAGPRGAARTRTFTPNCRPKRRRRPTSQCCRPHEGNPSTLRPSRRKDWNGPAKSQDNTRLARVPNVKWPAWKRH